MKTHCSAQKLSFEAAKVQRFNYLGVGPRRSIRRSDVHEQNCPDNI